MANLEHLTLLMQGHEAWNEWHESRYLRRAPGDRPAPPDLRGANLRGFKFRRIDLTEVNFEGADLRGASFKIAWLKRSNLRGAKLCDADMSMLLDLDLADLCGADLRRANLGAVSCRHANLQDANLTGVNLRGADLERSCFRDANLSGADLSEACLGEAHLLGAKFQGTLLGGTDFTSAFFGGNVFADVDLSVARRLGTATHCYASTIGVDTLQRSKGAIPEVFLRGCGAPESFMAQAQAQEEARLESCCISHHPKDEEFALRLQQRLQKENVRVWLAPQVRLAWRTAPEQMDEMIQKHDKLVMVISPDSMDEDWVKTELHMVREAESKAGLRKFFPVGLAAYQDLSWWKTFAVDSSSHLSLETWEYFVPDFSQWTDPESFEAGFARLLQDLKANEKPVAYDPKYRTPPPRLHNSDLNDRGLRKWILGDEAVGGNEEQ